MDRSCKTKVKMANKVIGHIDAAFTGEENM